MSSVEDFSDEMGEQSKKYFEEVRNYLKTKYLNNTSEIIKIETVVAKNETKTETPIQQNQQINVNLKIEMHDNSDTYWEERFKEIKKLTEKSYPSHNGLKIPEIMVLEYAETFTNKTEDIHSFWYYKYGLNLKEIQQILNKLLQKKFIQIAPAKETIKKFTVAKIKEFLKESGLKQSGRKAELLERLFANTSDEYLESKVTEKGFMLTDAGKQELKENDYVMYFHRIKNSSRFNVWQMNKKLHDNPEKTYREIMWEDLQKQYKIESHEIRLNGYERYTMICNDVCTFLLEAKGNAETALKYFAEATYYEVNYNMIKNYNLNVQWYNSEMEKAKNQKQEFSKSPPKIYDWIYIDEKIFNKIQEELEISDDEFCRRLDNIFFGFHVENPILSDADTAKFIVAKIKKDYETLDKMEYVID